MIPSVKFKRYYRQINRSRKGVRKELEASLKKLQTDHVDLIQVHAVCAAADLDMALAPDGAVAALEEARKDGLVRFIGITGHARPELLAHALKQYAFDTVLVALGMATKQRSVYAPDIPTLAEQGVAVESNSWNGLLAPAATPDAVVQAMNTAVNRALASPAVTAAFEKGGIASLSGTPEQFAAFIRSEIAKYAEVIRKGNITLEG